MRYPPLLLTGRVTVDFIRRTLPTMVNGRPVAGTETIVPIVCNVQPILKSTDTRLLAEADRSKATLKVYSNGAEIRALKEGPNGHAADRFYWQGDLYEVMSVISYDVGPLNHDKAICKRVELT